MEHLDIGTESLNLVWRRRVLDELLESQFIRDVLFAKLDRPVRWIAIEDDTELPLLDNVLVCSFGDTGGYLRTLRARGHRNIGVFHLGDERGTDDVGFYAEADYVLRHYFFPERLKDPGGHCRSVLWVPNGWARGIGPRDPAGALSFGQRAHGVFFAGYADGADRVLEERTAMLETLRAERIPATVVLSEGFGQGLGRASYGAYLSDARLALVPAGNSPETIRLYDALECGALPVVARHPWLEAAAALGALGAPPLITLTDWRDLAQVTSSVLGETSSAALADGDARRNRTVEWWAAFKAHTAARVAATINDAFTISQ